MKRSLSLAAAGMLLAGLFATSAAEAQQPAPAGPTLSAVRARGLVLCGTSTGFAGFSVMDTQGRNRGLDADLCVALAAAIFGDPARIRWERLTGQTRFPALQGGQVDVLMRTTTWTHSRDANLGLNFTTVSFFDGQGFLVRRDANIARAADLAGATICTTSGTTSELNLADWSRSRNIAFRPVLFEQIEEATRAYESRRCDALSTDASVLASIAAIQSNPAEHVVLSDLISKEPHSPVVRQGDDQWGDIVRWTLFALLNAEELGVTQANVDEMLRSPNPEIRRLLGVAGDHGQMMGLDARWAYHAIKAVGNYGEIFDRNLGANSPTRLARGLNALWSNGGAMYGMPIR